MLHTKDAKLVEAVLTKCDNEAYQIDLDDVKFVDRFNDLQEIAMGLCHEKYELLARIRLMEEKIEKVKNSSTRLNDDVQGMLG